MNEHMRMINGELCFDSVGILWFCYSSWTLDKHPQSRTALLHYCNEVAFRRPGKSSLELFDDLMEMDKEMAKAWLETTCQELKIDVARAIGLKTKKAIED